MKQEREVAVVDDQLPQQCCVVVDDVVECCKELEQQEWWTGLEHQKWSSEKGWNQSEHGCCEADVWCLPSTPSGSGLQSRTQRKLQFEHEDQASSFLFSQHGHKLEHRRGGD